ncbi:ABC transporter ATP-binding protein [Microbacterium album]|uniref:ABC transporter ATP-binding protein n=1 Tax=Microbacterium album TaxID=2053191 RepID=A0A917IE23_9MICO|nr:ABC transporter ATP-binding protein [Microbacterium album]GGH40270.1 putative ABC transporter ATP-binding protein [Microbacterium album]
MRDSRYGAAATSGGAESADSSSPASAASTGSPASPASTAERLALLWSFARPYLHVLALALTLSLAVSAMGLASPMVTKWVLDTLALGGSLRDPVLVLVGLLVLGAVVGWFQWVMLGRLAEDIVYDARKRMMLRYLGARVFALLSRGPGELVTRVTSDTVLLNQAASSSLIGLINGVVMIVGSLVLMAQLDLLLLGATLAAVVVVFALFAVLMPRISQVEEKAQAALSDLGSELEGTVRAIKTVKSSSAEARRFGSLMEHVAESRRFSLRSVRIQAGAWTIAGIGLDGAVIMVLAIGAYRISTGEMTVSALVAFLLYVWGLTGPLMELTQNLTALQSGMAAAGRIAQIEQLEVESGGADIRVAGGRDDARVRLAEQHLARPASAPPRDRDANEAPAVELRSVTARYAPDAKAALREVSLSIPRRGHVALVGPSGAGKTTALSLMLRFLEPESGELRLRGVPYGELSPAATRSAFAYVEQETPVVPGTIRENLLFSNPDAREDEIEAVLERVQLAEKIAELPDGLDTRLTDTNVSGGQRQRIAVARALLARPEILLLDEATAQVDGVTEAAIQEAIADIAERAVVVTIAHRLSTVIDADHIVVMEAGEVRASGTHAELLEQDSLYRDLVSALRIAAGT